MGKLYEGQVGVKIELETSSDLTAATLIEIKYKKPGAEKGVWPATVDGTKIYYTTATAGDLDKRGVLQVQAHVSGPGFDLLGETAEVQIHPPWG